MPPLEIYGLQDKEVISKSSLPKDARLSLPRELVLPLRCCVSWERHWDPPVWAAIRWCFASALRIPPGVQRWGCFHVGPLQALPSQTHAKQRTHNIRKDLPFTVSSCLSVTLPFLQRNRIFLRNGDFTNAPLVDHFKGNKKRDPKTYVSKTTVSNYSDSFKWHLNVSYMNLSHFIQHE